jgi:hypothetical protein
MPIKITLQEFVFFSFPEAGVSLRAGEFLHVGQIAMSAFCGVRARSAYQPAEETECVSVLFLLSMRHTTKGKRVGDHRLQMT